MIGQYLEGPPDMFRDMICGQLSGALMVDAQDLGKRVFDEILVPGPKLVLEHLVSLIPAVIGLALGVNSVSSLGTVSDSIIGELRFDNLDLGPALNLLRDPENFEATTEAFLKKMLELHCETALEHAKKQRAKIEKLGMIVTKVKEIAGDDGVLPLAVSVIGKVLDKRGDW